MLKLRNVKDVPLSRKPKTIGIQRGHHLIGSKPLQLFRIDRSINEWVNGAHAYWQMVMNAFAWQGVGGTDN